MNTFAFFAVLAALLGARSALAGALRKFQCRQCGKVITVSSNSFTPSATGYGKCPGTPTGAHIWRQIQ